MLLSFVAAEAKSVTTSPGHLLPWYFLFVHLHKSEVVLCNTCLTVTQDTPLQHDSFSRLVAI